MTMIDTPEGIRYFGLLQAAHRLALEINTPLKWRQSTLAACQRNGFTTKRTKKGCLEDLVQHLKDANPSYEPGSTIQRALGLI